MNVFSRYSDFIWKLQTLFQWSEKLKETFSWWRLNLYLKKKLRKFISFFCVVFHTFSAFFSTTFFLSCCSVLFSFPSLAFSCFIEYSLSSCLSIFYSTLDLIFRILFGTVVSKVILGKKFPFVSFLRPN